MNIFSAKNISIIIDTYENHSCINYTSISASSNILLNNYWKEKCDDLCTGGKYCKKKKSNKSDIDNNRFAKMELQR